MTEPQTPTGKDFLAEMFTDDADREVAARVVCAIEREAAAAERKRLRDVWDGWQEYGMPPYVQRAMDSGDTPHVVWRLLTDEGHR
jgi:hypothetical protein